MAQVENCTSRSGKGKESPLLMDVDTTGKIAAGLETARRVPKETVLKIWMRQRVVTLSHLVVIPKMQAQNAEGATHQDLFWAKQMVKKFAKSSCVLSIVSPAKDSDDMAFALLMHSTARTKGAAVLDCKLNDKFKGIQHLTEKQHLKLQSRLDFPNISLDFLGSFSFQLCTIERLNETMKQKSLVNNVKHN